MEIPILQSHPITHNTINTKVECTQSRIKSDPLTSVASLVDLMCESLKMSYCDSTPFAYSVMAATNIPQAELDSRKEA